MAFVTSGTSSLASFRRFNLTAEAREPARSLCRTPVRATAVQPRRTGPQRPSSSSASPPMPPVRTHRPRTTAPVIDSRTASRQEAHHWIVVKDHSRRLFERAAVAQADVAHQVEQRRGAGALHRWVLRQVADGLSPSLSLHDNVRYLVIESFDRSVWKAANNGDGDSLTRRWLSAVERVGPVISTVDIRSLNYRDVFTSKVHDVVFNPNDNVVVLESINVDDAEDGHALDAVATALKAKAERSVSCGKCLEFCVLQSTTKPSLFKTVEVYRDDAAMREHMNGLDKRFTHSVQAHVAGGGRNRHVFKPVVFA